MVRPAFSLIELLVTVVIVGTLAAMLGITFFRSLDTAEERARDSALERIVVEAESIASQQRITDPGLVLDHATATADLPEQAVVVHATDDDRTVLWMEVTGACGKIVAEHGTLTVSGDPDCDPPDGDELNPDDYTLRLPDPVTAAN